MTGHTIEARYPKPLEPADLFHGSDGERPIQKVRDAQGHEHDSKGRFTSGSSGSGKGKTKNPKAGRSAESTPPTPRGKNPARPFEATGSDMPPVFHGSKTKVREIDPSKVQRRDYGYYGEGFYVTSNPNTARTYGSKLSEYEIDPKAKVLIL